MKKKQENVTYSSKRLEVSSDSGPSLCISKWSDGGNHRVPKARKGGEHEWVIIHPYRKGSPPIFFYFERFYGRFNGFNAFWTRLQSLWIMLFFFARKDFPCGVRNRMQDKILFRQLRFSPFSSARYFDRQSLYILNGLGMGSRCSYYTNSQPFKL